MKKTRQISDSRLLFLIITAVALFLMGVMILTSDRVVQFRPLVALTCLVNIGLFAWQLLRAINEKTKAVVQMTLTTADEELCAIVEPNVSTTGQRVAALNALQAAGIPTVVWLCPILPFLNDTPENIRAILDFCADAGVKGVIWFGAGLTLRDGTQCLSARLEPLGPGESLVTVCEGKYHQVRRMMASREMTVLYLERRQEGSLTLGNLPRGQVRELTEAEIAALETV